jgi:thiol-disulfide isomerase/thioredoxin
LHRYLILGLALAGVAGGIVALTVTSPKRADKAPAGSGGIERAEVPRTVGRGQPAPELTGLVAWINSEPLTLQSLRGNVVLVDFWTYTCVNCIRTFPYLKSWYDKYASEGLVIIGVHTPEFAFEHDVDNVRAAVQRHGLKYPVALDNQYATWKAFRNQYWPRKYLIDKDGVIRYDHAGEGRYEATESWIKRLLAETGARVDAQTTVKDPDPGSQAAHRRATPELYAGLRGLLSGQIGNFNRQAIDAPFAYALPSTRAEHVLYLSGVWVQREESLRHGRTTPGFEDEIVLRYWARSVNLVIRPETSEVFDVRVLLDGRPLDPLLAGDDVTVTAQGESVVRVDGPRLYSLVASPEPGSHELRLSAKSDAFAIFAFTFGVGEQN